MAETTMISEAPLAEIVLERRRPGRTAHVSEHLIDLLRINLDAATAADDSGATGSTERLEPGPPRYMHGVLIQLAISSGLWSVIAVAVWLTF